MSPLTFYIAHGILKYIGNTIDPDLSVYTVMHTVNAVPTLHEWYKLKWSHNVIPDRGESPKTDRTGSLEFRGMNIKIDSRCSKPIVTDTDLVASLLKIAITELCVKHLGVSNQLYGTKFRILCFVNRWNDRQRLIIRLTTMIPTAKVFAHMESSKSSLEDMISVLVVF